MRGVKNLKPLIPESQTLKPYGCTQDPQARPSAADLQAHPFVAAPRVPAALAALRPLIRRSQEAAAAVTAEAGGPPKLPPGVRCRLTCTRHGSGAQHLACLPVADVQIASATKQLSQPQASGPCACGEVGALLAFWLL